ncbi:GntR family transcriptional regulator [Tsukamurella tyrosinosolvens]|uniref:GntR family transcriptional regulator n=1 Tax=Tsukamurella tyrosinosolvens TaxID=57704 RepID=UPI000B025973|nr:GntR family transcriptional regulator [Tsukamurella tyrosinosolvens]
MTAGADISLGEAAYVTIRDAIITGRLAPGVRITERGLATDLNLSLTPVRSAMTRLDHEGLIQTIPRKGYQVTPLTVRSVNELFEYWGMFAGAMTAMGLERANEAQVDELVKAIERLAAVRAEPGDSHDTALRVIDDSIAPFDVLAAIVGNTYLTAEYQRLRGEIGRVWIMVIESELLVAGRRIDDYDAGIASIRKRDVDSFVAFLRGHIEQSHLRVLSSLTRFPSLLDAEIVPIEGGAARSGT